MNTDDGFGNTFPINDSSINGCGPTRQDHCQTFRERIQFRYTQQISNYKREVPP